MDRPVQKDRTLAAGTNPTESLFRQRVTAAIGKKALAVSDNGRCVCSTAAARAVLRSVSLYKPQANRYTSLRGQMKC